MGKTLLKARHRRRKLRCPLPCKRFCSCCGETSIKPFPRQKRSSPKKQEARKFGKTASGSKRASVEVKQLINSRKSAKLSRGFSVRTHLKQVIVNVPRLSEDVLRVLSENGSICACNVSAEGVCKLSPSKSGGNACLVTPTRRLRSTQIQPVVRHNVMDSLRELNADWRSTTCPLSVNPCEAFSNVQEPEFSMKTLFLENLSICKKTPCDESAKENVKMHQNENSANSVNPRRGSQQLKMPMPSPSKVRFDPFPVRVKSQPQFARCRSLLVGNPNPGGFESVQKHTLRSLLTKHGLNPPPLTPLTRKSVATIPGVPRTLLKPHPGSSRLPKNHCTISAINSSADRSQDDDDVVIIETPPSLSPPPRKPHQPSSFKSAQKSKILVDSSLPENVNRTRSAHKCTNGMCCSKNVPSTSELNSPIKDTKPRIIRRRQLLAMRPGCSDPPETGSTKVSNPDGKWHSQGMSRRTNFTGNTPEVDDSCSSPKKQKIASKKLESSELAMFSSPNSGKPEKSHEHPPKRTQGIYTIIVTDSSDEEQPLRKAAPAKPSTPITKKCTPIRRSSRKKSKLQAASKAVLLKSKNSGRLNLLKTAVAVNRVQKRRNSLINMNPKNVLSDPESEEELCSDSEVETPRYVSRTGRSIGISTGCRSCPGCKIDRPRKAQEKPKLKPVMKKRNPQPMLPSRHEDSNASDSDFYTDIVHAGPEELVEDAYQTPESPPAVMMHGLTSSESSDEELLVLKGGRTALVVVPDEDAGEHSDSPFRSKTAEKATGPHVHSPVTGVSAKSFSKPTTDSEGPDHIGPDADVPVKFSEGALSSQNSRTKQLLNGKLCSKNTASASTVNHIHETYEHYENDDIVSDGASCSQIPVISKPRETQNVKTDVDDQEADGLPNSPHSASDVQCYLSQLDSNGTLLLHEINSRSSEDENIPGKNVGHEFQDNEKAASLGDGLSVPLLVDNSSETSDNSSALVNFDSQEYTECESTCSSQAGSVICNVDSSSVGDKHCSPRPFIEGGPRRREALSEDSELSQDTLKSRKHDGETPYVAQEDKVAAGSQMFEEGLTSGHAGGRGIWLDVPLPGDMEKPQWKATSTVHHADQDFLNTNKCQGGAQDTTTSLVNSASQRNAPLCEREPTPLETSTQEEDSVGDPSLALDGTGKIEERGSAARQDVPLQKIVDDISPGNCHSSRDNYAFSEDTVVGNAQPSLKGSSAIVPQVSNNLLDSPDESDPKCGKMLENGTFVERRTELYEENPDAQDASTNNKSSPVHPRSPGDSLDCGVTQAQAQGDSALEFETMLQNKTSKVTDQECQILDGSHNVLEIHVLEGCPSCRDDCHDSSINDQTLPEAPPERPSSPRDSPNCGVLQPQGGTFYHAISNLLIDCLNNVVESVKLDNREVIIKKVNPESPDALETNPAAHEVGIAAEDLASILKELNLSVTLNPRLTIKKLPSLPRAGNSTCEINSASEDSTTQESRSNYCASNDHQVPESACPNSNTTANKSLYERKGYPTPIKRLDPTVLSVIKFNDLEIYNDEPSLNDPPESDRVECVSSKGIRLELNPKELANIENLLNTKISHLRDDGIKRCGKGGVKSFDIDELVIYNDEPPLNLTPVTCWRNQLPLLDDEDPEELVIDNDAPPLNEPINDAPPLNEPINDAPLLNEPINDASSQKEPINDTPLQNEPLKANPVSKPGLIESECMVISSDDEMVMTSRLLKDAVQTEAISTPQEASDEPSKPLERPRKKLFRKRRNSKNTVEAPSVIDLQRSQMALCGEDPLDYFGAENQQILDLSELDCPSDDIIDEVVIDDGETFRQPSWKPLPPFQSCREVLHQPQVFNHQGQPLLKLGPSGHYGPNLAVGNSKATTSTKNVPSTSLVTLDLSKTFQDSRETKCMNISDSDTLTASEYGDEVIVVPPIKTSSSHVSMNISDSDTLTSSEYGDEVTVVSPVKTSSYHIDRFIEMQRNCRDKGLVQNVDTDSDDDVIVMSGPDKVHPVNNRLHRFPSPALPSPTQRKDLHSQGRKVAFFQPIASPQTRRNPSAQLNTRQVRTVRTSNGNSYLLLVVPPKTLQVNPRR